MTTFTFVFDTFDSTGKLDATIEYPFKGFSSESEAYEAFENMPEYTTDSAGNDYWCGSIIGASIETKES